MLNRKIGAWAYYWASCSSIECLSFRNNRALISVKVCTIGTTAYNLYLITVDDTPTFVVPNTIFGIAGMATGPLLVAATGEPHEPLLLHQSIYCVAQTVLYNWTNLLVFDLANQRQSSHEDALNKPWRPIPSGRMSSVQMRRLLLIAIPLVLAYNHFILHVGVETGALFILTWLYNDLGGGDENWILRNGIIACAFGLYNLGSLKVAAISASLVIHSRAAPVAATRIGLEWAMLISGVIFTTMHVQDLKDVEGDKTRGRCSAPIILGPKAAAWTVAVPVLLWSAICSIFWNAPLPVVLVTSLLGISVSWRCVVLSGTAADRRTWQLWCAWTAMLYIMPPLSA
ncbi:hypothetical protein BS50DRAFT_661341 [Corynespora cassiicola Philippines]|uniref:UbiA prenyltransferase n=1 Tax=Corynespora cassiicola Philippines TaxID=1448308 RepID=A0A2T2N0I1_CORCC|nr:hypothetical protein BS50DRAFT_661341 [Corynespora cassiicola Philippines]